MLRSIGSERNELLTLLNQIELVQLNQLCDAAGKTTNLGLLFQTIIEIYKVNAKDAEDFARKQLIDFSARDQNEFRSFVLFLQEYVKFLNFKNEILERISDSMNVIDFQYTTAELVKETGSLISSTSQKIKDEKIKDFLPSARYINVEKSTRLNDEIEAINRDTELLNKRIAAWNDESNVASIQRTNYVSVNDALTENDAQDYLGKLSGEKEQIITELERLKRLRERSNFQLEHDGIKARVDALNRDVYELKVFNEVKEILQANIRNRFYRDERNIGALHSGRKNVDIPAQISNTPLVLPSFFEISMGQKSVTDAELKKLQDDFKHLVDHHNDLLRSVKDDYDKIFTQLDNLSRAIVEQKMSDKFSDAAIDAAVASFIAGSHYYKLNSVDSLLPLPSAQSLSDAIDELEKRKEAIEAHEMAVAVQVKKTKRDKQFSEFADILIKMYGNGQPLLNSKLVDKFKAELISRLSEKYPNYDAEAVTDARENATIFTGLYSKYMALTSVLEQCEKYEHHLAKANKGIIAYQDIPPEEDFKVTLRHKMKVNADIQGAIINAKNSGDAIAKLKLISSDKSINHVLTANRDGFGTRLLKGILLVLSFGQTAKSPGLWKSHGAIHAEKLESIVNPAKGRSRN